MLDVKAKPHSFESYSYCVVNIAEASKLKLKLIDLLNIYFFKEIFYKLKEKLKLDLFIRITT